MNYVYILQSKSAPNQRYVGLTRDLKTRLAEHNTGRSPHTAKFSPWTLVGYVAFADKETAVTFEKYLKSGSGRAFLTSFTAKGDQFLNPIGLNPASH